MPLVCVLLGALVIAVIPLWEFENRLHRAQLLYTAVRILDLMLPLIDRRALHAKRPVKVDMLTA